MERIHYEYTCGLDKIAFITLSTANGTGAYNFSHAIDQKHKCDEDKCYSISVRHWYDIGILVRIIDCVRQSSDKIIDGIDLITQKKLIIVNNGKFGKELRITDS